MRVKFELHIFSIMLVSAVVIVVAVVVVGSEICLHGRRYIASPEKQ